MSDAATRLSTALADRYQVVRELGHGGMATVYLARDIRHERDVAIKVLAPRPRRRDRRRAISLARSASTASLHHPNIVPLYDRARPTGTLYYVMPVDRRGIAARSPDA